MKSPISVAHPDEANRAQFVVLRRHVLSLLIPLRYVQDMPVKDLQDQNAL